MPGHHLEILPLLRHRWIVRYEGDVTPLSEHPTLTDARTEARNHARLFGDPVVHVHELDGECHTEYFEPDPTPAERPRP